jgi:hypothetical protein
VADGGLGGGVHRCPGWRSIRQNDEISLDGLPTAQAKERIAAYLQEKGIGRATVNYKLRDWLFSRQRYWGEPFPVVFDEDGVAHSLPDSMLPLSCRRCPTTRPKTYDPEDAASEPETPLSRVTDWVQVELDLGDGRGTRRFRARRTPCPTGPARAGTTCATSTRPTHDASRRPGERGVLDRPAHRAGGRRARGHRVTRVASTSTSVGSSTPCCTCSMPASGTRCCTTWGT